MCANHVSNLNRPGLKKCLEGFRQQERERRDSHKRGQVWERRSRRGEIREVVVERVEVKVEEEEWVRNNMRAWQERERKREERERERRKGEEKGREEDNDKREDPKGHNSWLVWLSLLLFLYGCHQVLIVAISVI